jgi:phage-related holin
MDIGFIVFVIVLLIGTAVVKWKNMKNVSSKMMFFTIVGMIVILIIICIKHKAYSIMSVSVMRNMVMGLYDLMKE